MNDPNGLLYENGRYHLFYQYYPDDTVWGPMHWGHAVSRDLVNWEHLPIALYPDENGLCFSGSAVMKGDRIAAIYTSHGKTEQQSVAFSEDGVHFTPYEGNPVLRNTELSDFRDPKAFQDPVNGGWSLALAAGDRAMFFHSEDLLSWEKTGEFGPFSLFDDCVWECPSIVQVGDKWVFFTSVGKVGEKPMKDMYYWIGRWDGSRFLAETEAEIVDLARDDYAGVTFEASKEPTMIAWASQWVYANELPTGQTDGFRSQMTLARRLSLKQTDRGWKLAVQPVLPEAKPDQALDLSKPFAVTVKADQPFEIRLTNGEETFAVGLDRENRVYMDRTGMAEADWSRTFSREAFSRCRAPRYYDHKPCDLTLYFDVTVAEVYADEGTLCGTMLAFPKIPFDRVEFTGVQGTIMNLVSGT